MSRGARRETVFVDDAVFDPLRPADRVGRPIGKQGFVKGLEKTFDRPLPRQKRRPKPKTKSNSVPVAVKPSR